MGGPIPFPNFAEERFRLVVEAAPSAMIMVDREGRIVMANRQAEVLFGYRRDELGRLRTEALVPERFRGAHAGYREAFLGDPKTRALGAGRDLFGLRKDGTEVPIEIGLNPIETPEGLFTLASIIDITERRQMQKRLEILNEELEHKVEERTALAEERARKLRELATALTLTEQRERRRLARILHDHLQQMLVAAKLGLEQLRWASDQEVLHGKVADLEAMLDEAIRASRSLTVELSPPILRDAGLVPALEWLGRWMFEKHGLSVSVEARSDHAPISEEVRIFVFQAVRELLFNVVKHAGTDRATVRVGSLDNRIAIEVRDEGRGFDPMEVRSTQRESAFGLDNIRERLGVLSCEMTVNSAPGRGTRIRMLAPVMPVAPHDKIASLETRSPPRTHPTKGSEKIRILVVDDHRILRQGIIKLLQGQPDMEVAGEAADGGEVLEKTRVLWPDVILMDFSMPTMNGVEATRLVKSRFPGVRVIGLSLHESEDMQKTMLDAGAEAYLSKSGPIDDLVKTVQEVYHRPK